MVIKVTIIFPPGSHDCLSLKYAGPLVGVIYDAITMQLGAIVRRIALSRPAYDIDDIMMRAACHYRRRAKRRAVADAGAEMMLRAKMSAAGRRCMKAASRRPSASYWRRDGQPTRHTLQVDYFSRRHDCHVVQNGTP